MTDQNERPRSSEPGIDRCISYHVLEDMDDADMVACGHMPDIDDMHEATFMMADSFLWVPTSFVAGVATYRAASLTHRHVDEYPSDSDDETVYPEPEPWALPNNSWAVCHLCLEGHARALASKGEDHSWIDQRLRELRKRRRRPGVPDHVTVGPLEGLRTRGGLPADRG